MSKIIVCDIDGTIADLSHRLHYIQGDKCPKWIPKFIKNFLNKFEFIRKYFVKKKDWKSFFDEVDKDEPIEDIIDIILRINDYAWGHHVVYITGRNETCEEKTRKWIKENVDDCFSLLMRKQNDRRPDTEVKPELLEQYLKDNPESEVAFILEDRNSMVKKWRELGYTCLQVADGDF